MLVRASGVALLLATPAGNVRLFAIAVLLHGIGNSTGRHHLASLGNPDERSTARVIGFEP